MTVGLVVPTAEHADAWADLFDDAEVMRYVGTGEVAGFTGVQPWAQPWGSTGVPDVGWRLGRRFWGRGVATAAAREALDRVRALRVPRVVAMVHPDDAASLAVARTLGLTEEAVVRAPTGATVLQYGAVLGGRVPGGGQSSR